VPALLGAGALAGNGRRSLAATIAITVVASLGADLTWSAGQACVSHLGAFQLSARFLPELNPIAAGMAGATRSSMRHFVCRGTVSAVTWAGAWIGCGYLLSATVTATASRLGLNLIVLFLAPVGLYLLFHRARRRAANRLVSR